jgi:DNA-binding winged helix-turn-helix (wHTH) protein
MSDSRRDVTAIFKFADFELDARSRELRKRGRRLGVQQQPLQVLTMLVAAPGDVITRDELRERIWGTSTHVDFDRAINKAITHLRQVLDDDASRPRFIETLPKRGYRFVADVRRLDSRRGIKEDAKEAYLKARHFWNKRTPDDLKRSIDYFHRAIERDPDYPLAWTGLADAHTMIGIFGLRPPGDVFPPAKAAAERALALDVSLAEGHTVLAEIQKLYEWNWDAAERSYRRALELDPGYSVAHHWYAQLLSILARHDQAYTEMEAARRCDPLSPTIAAFISYAAFEARRYEAAVATAHDALELDAHAPLTHYMLGRAYAKLGDTNNAILTLEKGIRLAGWFPQMEATLAYVHALAGARPRAEQILASMRHRQLTQYVSPIDLAQVCLGLGDTDGAIAQLEEGYRTRAIRMVIIGDPFFSELGSDARYQGLMARLHLPIQR